MGSERDLISVPAVVSGMNPRQDRSWKLQFETRELSGDEVKLLADAFQGEGWLLFKPNSEVQLSEVPTEQAEAGVKSPSKRLYSVLFLYWKQQGSKGDFESYYRTAMQKLIEGVQDKLEPREEDNK